MSCGKKAWSEELAEENWDKAFKRFQGLPQNQVIQTLLDIKDDLERLISSDPSLTKVQWAILDSSLKRIKVLV